MSRSKRLQVATMLSLLAMSGLVACGDTGPDDETATVTRGDDYDSFDGHQISWEQ